MKTTKRKREPSAAKAKRPSARAKTVEAAAVSETIPAPEPMPVVEAVSVPAEPLEQPKASAPAAETGSSLVLASNCSVREAASLKEALCMLLENDDVVLDAGNLERVDTATVQLLCAFVRERAKTNRKVTWAGDSAPLRDAARLLGVTELLALPQGAAA
jgi:ABC-type transporter Mla MlaB component